MCRGGEAGGKVKRGCERRNGGGWRETAAEQAVCTETGSRVDNVIIIMYETPIMGNFIIRWNLNTSSSCLMNMNLPRQTLKSRTHTHTHTHTPNLFSWWKAVKEVFSTCEGSIWSGAEKKWDGKAQRKEHFAFSLNPPPLLPPSLFL